MILAIDIGNTNITVGCFDGERLLFIERISTNQSRTTLEHISIFRTIFELHGISGDSVSGGIISSVVPSITSAVKDAAEKIIRKSIMVLGPGVKTGLSIVTDDPAQLGSDLVAGAVAGIKLYSTPLIVIDMGTATTVSVVNTKKQYMGVVIIPGVKLSVDSLSAGTSQLPKISLEAPKRVIGTNTIDSMRSGIIYSNAAILDGIIDRIEEELGEKCTAVATGGLAGLIVPHCRRDIIINDKLLLQGLMIIYNKNKHN